MLFIGIKQPMKQNSKITKTAYLSKISENQLVHCHLIKKFKKSNQPVQKKGKGGKKWQIVRQRKLLTWWLQP